MKINCLIIDDDTETCNIVKNNLEKTSDLIVCDYSVTYKNGLEQALSGKYNALILDNYLDDNQLGIKLMEEVRASRNTIPIVILTSEGSKEFDLACMEAGANGFFDKKSIDYDLLERVIRYSVWITNVSQALSRIDNNERLIKTKLKG